MTSSMRRVLPMVAVTVALAGVTACSVDHQDTTHHHGGHSPSATNSSPRPAHTTITPASNASPRGVKTPPAKVNDHASGHQVGAAFVATMTAWDTKMDKRPNDASRRAAKLASPHLRHKMRAATINGGTGPGKRWNQLEKRHGWVKVDLQSGGRGAPPPSTTTKQDMAITATPTDHGAHGWQKPRDPQTWLVTVKRHDKHAPWRVSSFKIAGQ